MRPAHRKTRTLLTPRLENSNPPTRTASHGKRRRVRLFARERAGDEGFDFSEPKNKLKISDSSGAPKMSFPYTRGNQKEPVLVHLRTIGFWRPQIAEGFEFLRVRETQHQAQKGSNFWRRSTKHHDFHDAPHIGNGRIPLPSARKAVVDGNPVHFGVLQAAPGCARQHRILNPSLTSGPPCESWLRVRDFNPCTRTGYGVFVARCDERRRARIFGTEDQVRNFGAPQCSKKCRFLTHVEIKNVGSGQLAYNWS